MWPLESIFLSKATKLGMGLCEDMGLLESITGTLPLTLNNLQSASLRTLNFDVQVCVVNVSIKVNC